jgi:hypothetical protein
MMHPVYLPFTEKQLQSHFAEVRQNNKCNPTADKHIQNYKKSLANYERCPQGKERMGISISEAKIPCQLEKDEKFWTASCLMTIFYSQNRQRELSTLFEKAYGKSPPCPGLNSWQECFAGELHLFFETNLPSPKSYKKWLRANLYKQQFIPYVIDSGTGNKNLEGPTNADAVLLNSENGFAVIIEAKVLSDISYQITYDAARNQIARNIDVMLEANDGLCPPLDKRDPEKTLFLLLTSRRLKEPPISRLYSYKFNEYKNDPNSLKRDLQHRPNFNWSAISKRLGWLTWEDFKEVNEDSCKWLDI